MSIKKKEFLPSHIELLCCPECTTTIAYEKAEEATVYYTLLDICEMHQSFYFSIVVSRSELNTLIRFHVPFTHTNAVAI